MAFGTRAVFNDIQELDYTSLSSSYLAVGSALTDFGRIICFNNSTDVTVYISDNGVDNKIRLAPNSFRLFDFSTNRIRDDGLFVAQGTVFYTKIESGSPTRGAVWIEIVSAAGGV